jgi:hypothetical protein
MLVLTRHAAHPQVYTDTRLHAHRPAPSSTPSRLCLKLPQRWYFSRLPFRLMPAPCSTRPPRPIVGGHGYSRLHCGVVPAARTSSVLCSMPHSFIIPNNQSLIVERQLGQRHERRDREHRRPHFDFQKGSHIRRGVSTSLTRSFVSPSCNIQRAFTWIAGGPDQRLLWIWTKETQTVTVRVLRTVWYPVRLI